MKLRSAICVVTYFDAPASFALDELLLCFGGSLVSGGRLCGVRSSSCYDSSHSYSTAVSLLVLFCHDSSSDAGRVLVGVRKIVSATTHRWVVLSVVLAYSQRLETFSDSLSYLRCF